MARLRLFAGLREAAGTGRVEVPGATVGEVLTEAGRRFGPRFVAGLEIAKVWVNGDPATEDTPVADDDEIALLPPVSGGEGPPPEPMIDPHSAPTDDATPPPTLPVEPLLAFSAAILLAVAAVASPAWFVLAAVAVVLVWVWDLAAMAHRRGLPVNVLAALVGTTLGANAAYAWGTTGFAVGVTVATGTVLVWALFEEPRRRLDDLATTALVTVVATITAGALVVIRLRSREETFAFLAMAVLGTALGWLIHRYAGDVAGLDANLGALIGSVVAGVAAGAATDVLSLPVMALAGTAVAAGLIAGWGYGSLVRAGRMALTESPPGSFTVFDGVALAAPLFWVIVTIAG